MSLLVALSKFTNNICTYSFRSKRSTELFWLNAQDDRYEIKIESQKLVRKLVLSMTGMQPITLQVRI